MNRAVEQSLPPGLLDDRVEIFAHGRDVYYLTNGYVNVLEKAPEEILTPIREDIESRPLAVKALNELQITNYMGQLLQYARCVCGGFQGKADIIDGKLVRTEYWDCGIRGNCKYEGKLCCSITVNGQRITEREIELGKYICQGLLDKEIADIMNISENTINPMKRSICEKIAGSTKLDIMNFFIRHGFYEW